MTTKFFKFCLNIGFIPLLLSQSFSLQPWLLTFQLLISLIHIYMDSSSSSSSFPITSSIKDEDRGEMLQLDPDDEHYFQNYNHFAALDEQGSSVDEPVNIMELIEEYERLHPNSTSSSSISSSLSSKSGSEGSSKSIQVSVQQHSTYYVHSHRH